ncbi:hypothetical protein H2O64_02700 [Kordia sp. YSTF-M3]|uniref:Uncharacterized protein n=1 Tax=Kordia aestuariivivens TaxID=2759037 RepID=A0ABR7Q4Q7_9FLAO|nr:hypothetical protein [Kordia aestuariivivens]MBC8753550.1 hypothetical protein [Kordia aestuariivivens]MBC8753564.1 hypothetical protein [Kordia aestuariivivens]
MNNTMHDFSWLLFLAQLLPILKIIFWIVVGYYTIKLYKAILRYVTRFDSDTE